MANEKVNEAGGSAPRPPWTPGPWSSCGGNVHKSDGGFEFLIALCRDTPPINASQRIANAQLIAAAPELYESLLAVCNAFGYTAPECLPGRAVVALQNAGDLLRKVGPL